MSIDLDRLARPPDPVFGYLAGQMRDSHRDLLASYAAEGEAAVARHAPLLDRRYGPHERSTFDVFRSRGSPRGTLLFLHAGYWQSRDKSQFRFIAPPFLDAGLDVVLANYPLCPDVTLPKLVEAVKSGVAAILAELADEGRDGRAVVAGHSAGGHLAVELALTDWAARGVAASPIAGIVPISGVFELRPLVPTRLNDALRLTEDEALALSPLHRVSGEPPPARFLVGADETPDFQSQTEAMHEAWLRAGAASTRSTVAAADHFGILRAFAGGAAFASVLELFAPPA